MKSEDVIRFREDICITSDIFTTLCGNFIGEGATRCVFEHNLDNRFVVKVAICPAGVRANIIEHEVWKEVEGLTRNLEWVKDWFAPVIYISENGNVLIMRKTEIKPNKKKPNQVPKFLLDCYERNFGWIGNKYVCHDYGFIWGLLKYEKRFKRPNWA